MPTAITWIKVVAFQEWLDAIICNKQKGGYKNFQVLILILLLFRERLERLYRLHVSSYVGTLATSDCCTG